MAHRRKYIPAMLDDGNDHPRRVKPRTDRLFRYADEIDEYNLLRSRAPARLTAQEAAQDLGLDAVLEGGSW